MTDAQMMAYADVSERVTELTDLIATASDPERNDLAAELDDLYALLREMERGDFSRCHNYNDWTDEFLP